MTELRECPFCGGEVKRVNMEFVCLGCSAVTQFLICSVTTHAARLWNTRSYDGLVGELVEALRAYRLRDYSPLRNIFAVDHQADAALTRAREAGYGKETG